MIPKCYHRWSRKGSRYSLHVTFPKCVMNGALYIAGGALTHVTLHLCNERGRSAKPYGQRAAVAESTASHNWRKRGRDRKGNDAPSDIGWIPDCALEVSPSISLQVPSYSWRNSCTMSFSRWFSGSSHNGGALKWGILCCALSSLLSQQCGVRFWSQWWGVNLE